MWLWPPCQPLPLLSRLRVRYTQSLQSAETAPACRLDSQHVEPVTPLSPLRNLLLALPQLVDAAISTAAADNTRALARKVVIERRKEEQARLTPDRIHVQFAKAKPWLRCVAMSAPF